MWRVFFAVVFAAGASGRMEVKMQEFSFSTRIFFGEGALERLRRVEDRRVLIVTDQIGRASCRERVFGLV